MRTIRIDEDVYQFLKDRAEPLNGKGPNHVLREVLGFDPEARKQWSYQASLRRIAQAIDTKGRIHGSVKGDLRTELESVWDRYRKGAFGPTTE